MDTALLSHLARNPALPSALVDRMIGLADAMVCLEIAGRDDLTPEQVRSLLALDDSTVVSVLLEKGRVEPADVSLANPSVALVVAGRPDADPAVVRALAAHPDSEVRARLPEWAAALPPDVIDLLAHDPDDEVVAELVIFHALPSDLAAALSGHPSFAVRRALAVSKHTPPQVLTALSAEADDDMAYALACNPATPAATAASLMAHPSAHNALARRTDLPAAVYEQLADDPRVGHWLATNPAVPLPLLRKFATSPVLHNPSIPLDLLVELAGTTRIGPTLLPRIKSASTAELRELASSTTMQARMLVAEREDLPADLFAQLLADPDPGVAKAVVTHPSLTAEQLRELVERHGPRLYPRAARNPVCPPELLHQMAWNAASVQKAYREIAQHPNASAETLLLCLQDREARRFAAEHPNLPPDKIVELLTHEESAASNPSLPVRAMTDLLEP